MNAAHAEEVKDVGVVDTETHSPISRGLSERQLEDASSFDDFEWLVSFEQLHELWKDFLEEHAFPLGKLSALVLGCGTSGLSAALVESGLCNNVLSLDISSRAVEIMKRKYSHVPELEWAVVDLNDFEAMGSLLKDRKFDLVVDKATLDAILCEPVCAGYLESIERFLSCCGAFLCLSLHGESLMRKIFDADGVFRREWDVHCSPLMCDDGVERCFVGLVDKRRRNSLGRETTSVCQRLHDVTQACSHDQEWSSRDVYEKHVVECVEWYHVEEFPLLSKEREEELRASFAAQSAENIPLQDAYALMFSSCEKSAYSFEDFLLDLSADKEKNFASEGTMTIDSAICFLNENQ